ncbi:MAG: ATP synthase F0 subunit A [Bacteroidetes bacterium]|nr:MAG: ATP synthase F0 subunit A [Bacteroidota bacterium]
MINLKRNIFKCVLTTILIFNISLVATANTNHKEEHSKFKPGEFIMHHIYDAHEWHICTIGEKHICIPLLIIVHSETKGWNVFSSRKFHHGEKSYKGFKLEKEGKYAGKIVEVLDDGVTINEAVSLPLDFSITKDVVGVFFSLLIMLWVFISVAKGYDKNKGRAPKGIQSAVEPIILFIRDDIAKPSIGEKQYEKFTPFLLTIFFFILINNLFGLIPIFPFGANLTGNITITMVLALFTFFVTNISANKHYWKEIFNSPTIPWWLKFPIPLVPIVEILGMFTKPLILMIRLFANMSSGHIIALGFFSLIFVFGEMSVGLGYGVSLLSVAFSIFMTMLDLLISVIQAYVFTLLSAIYFGMATEEH